MSRQTNRGRPDKGPATSRQRTGDVLTTGRGARPGRPACPEHPSRPGCPVSGNPARRSWNAAPGKAPRRRSHPPGQSASPAGVPADGRPAPGWIRPPGHPERLPSPGRTAPNVRARVPPERRPDPRSSCDGEPCEDSRGRDRGGAVRRRCRRLFEQRRYEVDGVEIRSGEHPCGIRKLLPAAPASPSETASATATVAAASSPLGTILVDGKGRTLYLWVADTTSKSNCSGECAKEWPPLTVSGAPVMRQGREGRSAGYDEARRRQQGSHVQRTPAVLLHAATERPEKPTAKG